MKISVVISDLFGASGRRFLDALVAGERCPAALAALGDPRLHATSRSWPPRSPASSARSTPSRSPGTCG